MKRILSLALVLVMILSVMPVASAGWVAGCSGHDTTGEDHWTSLAEDAWVEIDHAENVAATCIEPGIQVVKCPYCDAAKTRSVSATGEHSYTVEVTEGDDRLVAANCKEAGTGVRKCANCTATETYTIEATGNHTYNSNGVCTNVLHDGTQCGEQREVTYTLVVPDTTLEVQKGNKISIGATVTRTPVDSGATLPTISYSGGESSIATIDSATGQITGVGVGTTSFTVSAEGCETVTVSVTVYNSGVIGGIENTSTMGSSVTLTPTLKIIGSTVSNVTFSFKSGSTVLGTGSSVQITGSNEIKSVTVSVVKYTIDGTEYSATGANAIADKTVKISFYDFEDASATVKSGIASFMFDDASVFSKAVIDDVTMSKPENITMQNLFTYSGSVDLGSYRVVFYPESYLSGVASITYTSIGGDTFGTGAGYSFYNTQNLKFTVLNEGEYEYDYELVTSEGLIIQAGTVTIKTNEGDADIKYKTNYTTAITIDEDDFEELWEDSGLAGDLEYVTFQVDDSIPWYGSLYTTASSSTRKAVTDSQKFYFEATASNTYDLDAVTFVPHSSKTSPYTEIIPFTCVGTTNKTLNGTMEIKVGEDMKFTDVKKTDYFYDAVVWAVGEGITSGTSSTTFSPNATCTRAQVVTFLYRAAGEPTVTGALPFTDVKYTDYYYDAVLWAYQNDITTGLTATTFGPNATVTRGQVVTFLHRALNEPYSGSYNPFTDVKSSDYFADAVLWAYKNDVTTGLTATSFGPNSGCTRGQIVTFLYRAYEG